MKIIGAILLLGSVGAVAWALKYGGLGIDIFSHTFLFSVRQLIIGGAIAAVAGILLLLK